jgi:hypothetical protein
MKPAGSLRGKLWGKHPENFWYSLRKHLPARFYGILAMLKAFLPPVVIIGAFWVLMGNFTGTPCVAAAFTGLPCPSCGITRAGLALLRGDFASSFYYYPPLYPLFAVLVFSLWARYGGGGVRARVCARRVQAAFIVLILAVYAVRMFLFFPDTEPMTFNERGILPRLFTSVVNASQVTTPKLLTVNC